MVVVSVLSLNVPLVVRWCTHTLRQHEPIGIAFTELLRRLGARPVDGRALVRLRHDPAEPVDPTSWAPRLRPE